MITYNIEGCNSTFKSKPENFERDVLRWKQRHSLRFSATVTIIENDELPKPAIDSTSTGNLGEQPTLSESTPAPKRSNKRKPATETADVPAVLDSVDESNLLGNLEHEWNDVVDNDSPESN